MPDPLYKKDIEVAGHHEAILILILTIVMIFFVGVIVLLLGLERSHVMLAEALIILPAFIYVKYKGYSRVKTFRLNKINSDIFLSSVFIGLSLAIVSDELDRLIALFFPMPDFFERAIIQSLTIHGISDLFVVLSSSVFFAVICEELLFRGFVQTSFENTFDVTKAIMLTALIFAIIHMNPWWTIQIIIVAIFLGVMAWKSDSILPSMIVHGTNNALGVLFINMSETSFSWYLYKDHVHPIILVLALSGLFYGVKLFYRNCDENKQTI